MQTRILHAAAEGVRPADYSGHLAGTVEVTRCADSASVLESLEADSFPVVLLDLSWAAENDYQLLRQIRSQCADRPVAVVLVAAAEAEPLCWQAIEQGADDYLLLPASPLRIAAKISVHLKALTRQAQALEERRHWRREADAAQERLETVLTSINDHLATFDQEWRYTYVNDGAARMVGKSKDELLGNCIWDLFPEAIGNEFYQQMHRAAAEGTIVRFEHYYEPFGRWYDNYIYPLPSGVAVFTTDATERKQAAAALEARERRFRALIENSWDVIAVVRETGEVVYSSPAVQRVLGYSPDDFTSRPALEWIHADDRARVIAALASLRASQGSSQLVSCRARHRNGSWRYLDICLTNLMSGEAVGEIVCNFRDVTQQRLVEDELRDSENLFQSFMDNSPSGAWIKDEQGQFVFVNRRLAELFGRSTEEWIDARPTELFPDEVSRVFSQHDALVRESGSPQQAIERVTFDRQERFVLSIAFPLRDRRGRSLVGGVIFDVTQQKQVEQQLSESRRLFERMAEASPDVLYRYNLALGRYVYTSQSVSELLGHSAAAAADEEPRPLSEFVHPEDRGRVAAHLRSLRDMQDNQVLECEYRVRRADGSDCWLQSRDVVFLRDGAGQVREILGLARDITDQKLAAIELVTANRQKDDFLAMLAHELRNPLAPIQHAALLLAAEDLEPETSREVCDILQRQVDHLSRLVDDLLDVSRIIRGKIELRRDRVELAQVVAHAVEAAQPLMKANSHELSVSLPEEPICLYADSVRLAQIISNLLNNAAKYTNPGGRISLFAEREREGVCIRVRDTGIGISADLLPRVFDLFVQGDATIERSRGGLGLGLTLVRNLVELHDGSVTVHSEGPGYGSEFIVRLPSLNPRQLAAPPTDGPQAIPPARVLIVEDNLPAAKMLGWMLQKFWNHEVQMAHDGLAALEMARTLRPDIVLCDLGLPGVSGYDVARQLRRETGFERVLLVALTGYGTEEDRRKSAEAGFDEHLVKPATTESLQRVFARIRSVPDGRAGAN